MWRILVAVVKWRHRYKSYIGFFYYDYQLQVTRDDAFVTNFWTWNCCDANFPRFKWEQFAFAASDWKRSQLRGTTTQVER